MYCATCDLRSYPRISPSMIVLITRGDEVLLARSPRFVPGVYSTLAGDLYIILADWNPIYTNQATFKIYYNPLINWLWIGGLIFMLGTLVAAWPPRKNTPLAEVV